MKKIAHRSLCAGLMIAAGVTANADTYVLDDFTTSPDQLVFVNPFGGSPISETGIDYLTGGGASDFLATPSIHVNSPLGPVAPNLVIAGGKASGNVAFGDFDTVTFQWLFSNNSGPVDMFAPGVVPKTLGIFVESLQGDLTLKVTISDGVDSFSATEFRSDLPIGELVDFKLGDFVVAGVDFDSIDWITIEAIVTETTDFVLDFESITGVLVPSPAAGAGVFGLAMLATRRRRLA